MALRFHNLRVVAVIPTTEDAVSVEFEIPKMLRKRFSHHPGQYLTLAHDFPSGNERRTYSIHEPSDGPCSVLVKRVPGGLFSSFVNDRLKPGDTLDVMEPAGTFGHDIDPARVNHILACAAGSGITPVLPIIEAVLDGNTRSTATLIYCNQTMSSIIFRERLCDLKDKHMERLVITHVLSREQTDIPMLSGRIDASRASDLLDAFATGDIRRTNCLLCGPEELMDTMERALVEHGFDLSQIHRERFNAPKTKRKRAKKRKVAGMCDIEVVLNGSRNKFEAPKDQTLLESIRGHGLEAPFSCTGGVCSTCRARLFEGSVEMDVNYALEDQEVEDGMILACQSRPTTDSVMVDFDKLWG